MLYTKEEILKAAEIGEVSMIDAKHIVSLLDRAKSEIVADIKGLSKAIAYSEATIMLVESYLKYAKKQIKIQTK